MRNKKGYLSLALITAFLALAGCGTFTPVSRTVYSMDTVMSLTVYGSEEYLDGAESIINDIEDELSVTDKESDIYKLNLEKEASVSDDTAYIVSEALKLCEETGGALDISIYPVVKAWGFTTGEYRVPTEVEITDLIKNVSYKDISVNGNVISCGAETEIDLGSVAKGYTADRLKSYLKENGVESALLSLGGNIQTVGNKSDGSLWKIAVSDPEEDGYIGAVSVSEKAVVTSGGYERSFEENGVTYHHIIDPATGYPANNGFVSVTVIGDDGLMCDAYSTALFVMGHEKAFEFYEKEKSFDAVFLTSDGVLYITEGIEDSFVTMGRFENVTPVVLYHD